MDNRTFGIWYNVIVRFKRALIAFLVYYFVGFILMNVFSVSRFMHSANIYEVGPKIVLQNVSNPTFWGLTLVWPVYLGLFVLKFLTGNFD